MDSLVSICIPTRSRPSLLLHTLHSCFIQDYRPLDIDISDDSEADDTARLIASLLVPDGIRLRYTANRPSLGQAANVNRLFAEARGELLILLHDDDTLMYGAVSLLTHALHAIPCAVAAYGMQHVLSENGERDVQGTATHAADSNRSPSFVDVHASPLTRALWRQFPNNGYLVYTKIAREIRYRPSQFVGDACDLDFAIRLAKNYNQNEFIFAGEFTSEYRLTSSSLRTRPQTNFKIFSVLEQLESLSADEVQARDRLLKKIAHQAVAENAIQGERREALRIFLSKAYAPTENAFKAAYHLGLIAIPKIARLRKAIR